MNGNQRKTSAEYVTGFGTGWLDNRPDLLLMTLTTASGMKDFALTKDQALTIAKTLQDTAAATKPPASGQR